MISQIQQYVKNHTTRILQLVGIGLTMGAADVIPGVSGGTIAFIFGIYDELLASIKICSGPVLVLLLRGRVKEAIEKIPFGFLVPLFAGIGSALVVGAHLITYLLEHYPMQLNAFFFGLVLSSIFIVLKRVKGMNVPNVASFVLMTVGAFYLVGFQPVETARNLLTYFLTGMVAICAMILPGISGSFIMVILGQYKYVIGALKSFDLPVIIVFSAGCAIGLSLFARVLTWALKKNHDLIVSGLAGLMLGSLRVIWPWQTMEVVPGSKEMYGKEVIERAWQAPAADMDSGVKIGLMVAALVAMLFLERFEITKEHHDDMDEGVADADAK